MSITENIARVREQIASAAWRTGRRPEDLTLMAVSKTFPPAAIREAYDAGLRVFGENRVQEFSSKAEELGDLQDAQWHMIGHLQANKNLKAAELFSAVDSLDSLRLAERLNAAGQTLQKTLRVMIEINVGGEAAKSGVAPESPELEAILQAASRLPNLSICGLMTIPPLTEDPQLARPYFRRLREVSELIALRHLRAVDMATLSMGMSHDFEVAIEEGSTCVRVGTAIFGERNKTAH